MKIPPVVKVQFEKTENGLTAYLPEFDIFTEIDDPINVTYYVNDLLCCYFDIASKNSHRFYFAPVPPKKKQPSRSDINPFTVLFNDIFSPSYNNV